MCLVKPVLVRVKPNRLTSFVKFILISFTAIGYGWVLETEIILNLLAFVFIFHIFSKSLTLTMSLSDCIPPIVLYLRRDIPLFVSHRQRR